jgi:hypothetical protein
VPFTALINYKKNLISIERMEDTCLPERNKVLYNFRVYSIVFPICLVILFLETIFIFASLSSGDSTSLGTALTLSGPFPKIITQPAKN